MTNDELVSVSQAAEVTGYSRRTIQHLLQKKQIHGKKIARDWLVDLASLQQHQQQAKPGRPKRSPPESRA